MPPEIEHVIASLNSARTSAPLQALASEFPTAAAEWSGTAVVESNMGQE